MSEERKGEKPPTAVSSIYVHAPFCARRCVYCDFAVTVRQSGDLPAWTEALRIEFDHVKREGLFAPTTPMNTLYVGGGTPSLLGPDAMHGLADVLGWERLTSPELEWTAEANPESLTSDVARSWSEAGVNRLSLGVQSFNEEALRWMGRLHGPDGPPRAIESARAAGVENLSVDLIFGLPRRLRRSWEEDLKRVLDLDVPHVSLYGLTVEGGTPLGRSVAEGRESPVDEEQYHDEYLQAAERLTGAGYDHYEVSNFARPGAEARHNAVYWNGSPYLGLGNGAHSYAAPIRRWNVRDWEAYRACLLEGGTVEQGRESVDAKAKALEDIWLALRTRVGLPWPEAGGMRSLADAWCRRGVAVKDADRLRLTVNGWLLLDQLTVEYDDATDGPG